MGSTRGPEEASSTSVDITVHIEQKRCHLALAQQRKPLGMHEPPCKEGGKGG